MSDAVLVSIRREVARRNRKVQRTFMLPDPEPGPEPGADASRRPSSTSSGPPPCRAALAHWPDEWRERWGRRANELEDMGLSWQEAEARAFVEVWNERRALGSAAASPLPGGAERN